jgi:hypothetical protein
VRVRHFAFSVGDILVEPPDGIDPLSEFVDHVVIVIGDRLAFANVLYRFLVLRLP